MSMEEEQRNGEVADGQMESNKKISCERLHRNRKPQLHVHVHVLLTETLTRTTRK